MTTLIPAVTPNGRPASRPHQLPAIPRSARRLSPRDAIVLVQTFIVTLMVFPSDVVLGPIGAAGYVASLVAMFSFGVYWFAVVLGLHDFHAGRNPVRTALALLWGASLLSYAFMHSFIEMTPAESLAGDRWLMQLMAVTGVVHLAGECLNDVASVHRVLRALVWGGAFCGVVAALQFWLSLDVTWILRLLPGFEVNFENSGIISRGALNRVAGTAIHPIELGVVAAMVLPLAVYLAMHDLERSAHRRWFMVALVGLSVPASVSRSAILTTAIAFAVFVLLMPAIHRVVALAFVPVVVMGVFLTTPGLITTLTSFFLAGTADASIATRVDDYPFVEDRVRLFPWLGQGGGTFFPADVYEILDNQYLKTAIELGLVGLAALIVYLLAPVVAAAVARRRSHDPALRMLSAAVMGSALAAVVGSVTFDSWSFPMFLGVQSLVAGLAAACWRMASRESDARRSRSVSSWISAVPRPSPAPQYSPDERTT